MHALIRFAMLAAVLGTVLLAGPAVHGGESYDVYVVRHAEKRLDQGSDPGLTGPGAERAQGLAAWLSGRGIGAVWSTDTRRTRATVAPLAEELGLDVRLYDPRDPQGLADTLRAEGRSAVIAGHSNTVPDLASRFCGCPVAPMDEAEYSRLIRIRITGDSASLETLDQAELFSDP